MKFLETLTRIGDGLIPRRQWDKQQAQIMKNFARETIPANRNEPRNGSNSLREYDNWFV